MQKDYKIKAGIWRWPGDLGWLFVTLDQQLSEKIRNFYKKGFIKAEAKIGKTLWQTSLFPHMLDKKGKKVEYLLCINKKVQKAEGLYEGDIVNIKISLK